MNHFDLAVPDLEHLHIGQPTVEVYECDCGHQSHFFENTIREAKEKSHRKTVHLGGSASEEHIIVSNKGEMANMICPKRRDA